MNKENDNRQAALALGTEPVLRLLIKFATPAIIAMVASSLYNMVDSIFIGQGVGPLAISGLAITFPLMNISAAFGAAIGVGASTVISVKLGQKDYLTAQVILGNSVVLKIITGILFGGLALLFLDPILRFFGATENTLPYAREYMVVILLGNVFTHLYFGLNGILRAVGKPRHAMYATIFTVLLNTALDPLFIYTFGMGIQGAAIATVISQTAALAWQVAIFANKKELVHFRRGIWRLRVGLVKNILAIGASPFAMNVCACIVVIFINTALVRHGGDLAVGAYGIANRIGFIFFMVVMGINQGMQPIAGYNYGAGHTDRMMLVLRYSIIAGVGVMTVGWIVGLLIPAECARLFTTDPQLTEMGARGIMINQIAFPVIGYQAVITNFFQSIGKAKISILLSLSRQMIFLVPLLIVLPLFFGVDGVWYSLPASDMMAFVMTLITMTIYMKKLKQNGK
ncbi:MAG: MATE family efflux transporter [Prevotella sp.]|nr:MATE family efflux transporter [Prevotella sp.]